MRSAIAFLTLLVLSASPALAVNCRRACAPQIRKCIKKCCNPPAFGIPRRACIIGLRGAALHACRTNGPQACPKDACIIEDCSS